MIKIFTYPIFHKERKIRVYLPVGYENASCSYPVLYMHDGQNVFTDDAAFGGESLRLADDLDQQRFDLIVVAIDRPQLNEDRVNEYCPWENGRFSRTILGETSPLGGKGKDYVEVIINEIKPLIDSEFRTLPNRTSMAGISLGGLITTYAACCYPHIFNRIACLSSAFYRNQEDIEKWIHEADLTAIKKLYMDCGTNELVEDERVSRLFLSSNQSVYQLLRKKIQDISFQKIDRAAHDYSCFKKRMPEVLSFLCSD